MIVYLVMTEQHYAHNVYPDAIFSTEEKAVDYVNRQGALAEDHEIYKVTLDDESGIL